VDPALQEQIDQVLRGVLSEMQNEVAEAVRQQVEQALQRTGNEGVDEAAEPVRQQGDGRDQQPRESGEQGPPGRQERQSEGARQPGDDQDAPSDSPGTLQRAGAPGMGLVQPGQQPEGAHSEQDESRSPLQAVAVALKQFFTWLVNTLRELLRTLRGLPQTVVGVLRPSSSQPERS